MAARKGKAMQVSELNAHIGFWMRIVSNNVSYAFSHKLMTSGVTVAEWVIMREMFSVDGTTSSSVIAELTGLSRGAVSKLISRLLEKGLVTRKESGGDRRYQDIELTQTAVKLVPKLSAYADQNDEEFFSVITKTERKTLLAILKKTAKIHKFTKIQIQ
ncbi:MAG TPA: MarR family winged helix-turn-helix transcriptional regulator [Parachlamydiaceae bacterium]|nr:MarR family winged helix-turn-helix transcriptional regulator [Parachlamydiaceae bacterium]